MQKENDLRKAQERLDKVNKRSKQFQIDFRREQNRNGRFRTRPHITRDYKDYHGNNCGLIHKAVNLKYRIKGYKPSLTRYINCLEPTTFRVKAGKGAAKVVNFVVHDVGRTAVDTTLAAETVTLKTADAAGRELTNKLRQKYTREAVDDYHRGVFLMGRTSVDAVKGVRRHLKTKKQYKIEKAKLKLQRADNKLYKSKTHNPALPLRLCVQQRIHSQLLQQRASEQRFQTADLAGTDGVMPWGDISISTSTVYRTMSRRNTTVLADVSTISKNGTRITVF